MVVCCWRGSEDDDDDELTLVLLSFFRLTEIWQAFEQPDCLGRTGSRIWMRRRETWNLQGTFLPVLNFVFIIIYILSIFYVLFMISGSN